jgi:hypothetical protein
LENAIRAQQLMVGRTSGIKGETAFRDTYSSVHTKHGQQERTEMKAARKGQQSNHRTGPINPSSELA